MAHHVRLLQVNRMPATARLTHDVCSALHDLHALDHIIESDLAYHRKLVQMTHVHAHVV